MQLCGLDQNIGKDEDHRKELRKVIEGWMYPSTNTEGATETADRGQPRCAAAATYTLNADGGEQERIEGAVPLRSEASGVLQNIPRSTSIVDGNQVTFHPDKYFSDRLHLLAPSGQTLSPYFTLMIRRHVIYALKMLRTVFVSNACSWAAQEASQHRYRGVWPFRRWKLKNADAVQFPISPRITLNST